MKNKRLAILAIMLLAAGTVSADVITHTGTFPATANSYTIGIDLPYFNSTLGILESVSVQFNTSTSGTLTVTNDGEADTISVSLGELGLLLWPDNNIMLASTANCPTSYGAPYIAAGQTMNWNVSAFTGTAFGSSDDAEVLALFTGTGNMAASVQSSISYAWASTYGNQLYTITPALTTSGDWTVEYTYTVPEPATMVLLAVGSLILRRKSVS